MSQQGLRQASVRAVTGTAGTYEGDFHALFDICGIAPGDFNGRFLTYLNLKLDRVFLDLSGAMAAFAASVGAADWGSVGTFDASLIPPELFPDPGVEVSGNYSLTGNVSFGDPGLVFDDAADEGATVNLAGAAATAMNALAPNTAYTVTLTISDWTGTGFALSFRLKSGATVEFDSIDGPGEFSKTVTTGATTINRFIGSGTVMTVTGISVKAA